MNDTEYKNTIQFLVDALNEFKRQQLIDQEKIAQVDFEGVLGQDIQDTIYELISERDLPRFPQYKDLTRKEFTKLTLDEEILALQEIIEIKLYQNVPGTLPQMMEALSQREAQVKALEARGVKQVPIDQKFETRFRALVKYVDLQKAVGHVSDDAPLLIQPEKAEDVRRVAREQPQEFIEEVEKRVETGSKTSSGRARQVAQTYQKYLADTTDGQAIAKIDAEKIQLLPQGSQPIAPREILRIGRDIETIAKVVALPIAVASQAKQSQLAQSARSDPKFQERLAEQLAIEISDNKSLSELSPQDQHTLRSLASEYTQRLIQTAQAAPQLSEVMQGTATNGITVIDANLLKEQIEYGNKNITLVQVEAQIPEPVSGNMDNLDEFVRLAQEKPQYLSEEIIKAAFGNTVLSEADRNKIQPIIDNYLEAVKRSSSSDAIEIATTQATQALIKEGANNIAPSDVLTAVSKLSSQPVEIENVITKERFGSYAEILKIAASQEEFADSVPIIPSTQSISSPELLEGTRNILVQSFGGEMAESVLPSTSSQQSPEVPVAVGAWGSIVGKTYVGIGIKEIAKEDPIKAAALQLHRQFGINEHNFNPIRARALALGVNLQQLDQLKKNLKDIDISQVSFLNYVGMVQAGQRVGIDETTVAAIFANGQINPGPIMPGGGLIFNLGSKLFGKGAKKFIEGSITKGLTKAAEIGVGKLAQYAAGMGFVELGASIGSVVPILGTAIGAAVGWAVGKTVGLLQTGLKKNWGKVTAGIGAVLGFMIAGPIGLIVGGALGGALAGVDWQKWGRRARSVLEVLGVYFGAKLLLPLIVAGAVLIGGTIFVSLVIFIINSGAYVVPPSDAGLIGNAGGGAKIQCFVLKDFSAANEEIEKQAIDKMSTATGYMSKLCEEGDITIQYEAVQALSADGKPYGGFVSYPVIHVYNIGLLSVSNAFYTLTHETGHIFQHRYPEINTAFQDDPAVVGEGFVCTYPLDYSITEDFAESVAAYYSTNPVSAFTSFKCMAGQTFQTKYPQHWKFMNENVFK